MSILQNFYSTDNIDQTGDHKYKVSIKLNPEHEIFKGHFPGNPVTPGVCMMQIVKDIAEQLTNKKLMVVSANNVKFMAIINPDETPQLTLDLDIAEQEGTVKVKNTTSFGETIALKMSVNYKTL